MGTTRFDKLKRVKRVALVENTVLLLIHIGLLLFFTYAHIWIMVAVNMISVPTYILCYYVLYRRNYQLYLFISYTEIIVHMIFAVLCLGWNYGFELYSFGMIPTIYYGVYVKDEGNGKSKYANMICLLIAGIFVAIRVYTFYHPAFYEVHFGILEGICYLVNAGIVYGFLMYYLTNYSEIVITSEKLLKLEADYDSLTGLYNRRRIQYLLEEIYEKASRKNVSFAVSILDIDDFKGINDTYGHDAGDFILSGIADILKAFSSQGLHTTLVGRWGGEEFLVLQMYDENEQYPEERMEELRRKIMKNHWLYNRREIGITVTIGMTRFERGKSITELIREADGNLYIGKRQGKNMVVGQ